MSEVNPSHRPPDWPIAWLKLAALVGSTMALRARLSIKSKTTLSNKIHGHTCWSKADVMELAALCQLHGLSLADLIKPEVIVDALCKGQAWGQSPGPWRGEAPRAVKLPSSSVPKPVF